MVELKISVKSSDFKGINRKKVKFVSSSEERKKRIQKNCIMELIAEGIFLVLKISDNRELAKSIIKTLTDKSPLAG